MKIIKAIGLILHDFLKEIAGVFIFFFWVSYIFSGLGFIIFAGLLIDYGIIAAVIGSSPYMIANIYFLTELIKVKMKEL